MKKILALLLAMIMVFAMVACGNTAEDDAAAEEPAVAADAAAPADDVAAAPAGEAAAETGASGEMGSASGEASGETASAEAGGAQAGNVLDLSENAVIPTEAEPETYTADEAGWVEYMMDCAYYATGTSDGDNKLGAAYYDIKAGGMTDMFVNMWGVDTMEAFIANGGVPTVNPWTLTEGQGTPETVPDATETETAE